MTIRVPSFFAFALVALAAGALAPAPAAAQEAASRAAAITVTATVDDMYDMSMEVEDPSFFKPASGFSLGGGGGGKGSKLKELHLWRGAHEILVPIESIVEIKVGKAADQDLLECEVKLRNNVQLQNVKMDRDLELRGRVKYGQYQVKLERVKLIKIRS